MEVPKSRGEQRAGSHINLRWAWGRGWCFRQMWRIPGVVGFSESKRLHVLHLGGGACSSCGCRRRSLEWPRFLPGVNGDIRKWGQWEILGGGDELNSRHNKNDMPLKSRWLEILVWDCSGWWHRRCGFRMECWGLKTWAQSHSRKAWTERCRGQSLQEHKCFREGTEIWGADRGRWPRDQESFLFPFTNGSATPGCPLSPVRSSWADVGLQPGALSWAACL